MRGLFLILTLFLSSFAVCQKLTIIDATGADSSDIPLIIQIDNLKDVYYYTETYPNGNLKAKGWLYSDTLDLYQPILNWFVYSKDGILLAHFYLPIPLDSNYVVKNYYRTGELMEDCIMKRDEYERQKEEDLKKSESKNHKRWVSRGFEYNGYYCTKYRKNGTKRNECFWINDNPSGPMKLYDKDGNFKKIRSFKDRTQKSP